MVGPNGMASPVRTGGGLHAQGGHAGSADVDGDNRCGIPGQVLLPDAEP